MAGDPAGPYFPRAGPLQRDAAHRPAGLQNPPDATEEGAGGRQQRGRQRQRQLGREQAARPGRARRLPRQSRLRWDFNTLGTKTGGPKYVCWFSFC